MDTLIQDLRYGMRGLLRGRPLFSLVIIVTIALGIGATTALFSLVDAVLLRPLPFADPDRLVYMQNAPRRHARSAGPFDK